MWGHITHMIDDLLDVSRITRGLVAIDRHPIELGKLLKDTAESVQSFFIAKQQTLNSNCPPSLSAWMQTRFGSLRCSATCSSTPTNIQGEGGCIDLSVNIEGPSVVVRIQDNGIGIKPQLLPHIFGLFTQGKRTLGVCPRISLSNEQTLFDSVKC